MTLETSKLDPLDEMKRIVQEDVGERGLRTVKTRNPICMNAGALRLSCRRIASAESAHVAIVTGFFIPTSEPAAAETDGPLGAVFLARALTPLRMRVSLLSDAFCVPAMQAGLEACGLRDRVAVVTLPPPAEARTMTPAAYAKATVGSIPGFNMSHLIAIERVGPSHTVKSLGKVDEATRRLFLREVPEAHRDRCHTMRGLDVTDLTSPAHWLVEEARRITTIGIGDGGNELGMGKIPWDVIRRNIPRGALVACRVPTDFLIVAGISNWGAYALAAGVYRMRGAAPDLRLFEPEVERRILEVMVERGPLVDPIRGKPSVTVDGVDWEPYGAVLPRLRAAIG